MSHLWLARPPARLDRDWFATNQGDLVAFANSDWGRRFLRLDDAPVVQLWPSAVHYADGKDRYRAEFRTAPSHARRLLAYHEAIARWGELGARLRLDSPARESLAWLAAAVSTFNPNANPETSSVDGRTERAANEVWATIRAGSGTNAQDAQVSETMWSMGTGGTIGVWATLDRGILVFDTSTIGQGAVLSAATIALWVSAQLNGSTSTRAMTSCVTASDTALVNADFNIANMGSVDLVARESGVVATGASHTFTCNAAGLANINPTGKARFATRWGADVDNIDPGPFGGTFASFTVTCSMAENTTAVNRPLLTVTYEKGNALFMLMDL